MGRLLKIGVPIALQERPDPDRLHCDHDHCQPPGIKRCRCGRHCGEDHQLPVPGALLHALHRIRPGRPEYRRRQAGAGKAPLRYAAMIAVGFGAAGGDSDADFRGTVVSLFTDSAQADGARVVTLGGQYLRGYVWDCIFAGIHFSFSGYFCACGNSGLSFLHNILAIVLVRVPGVYLTSQLFPDTLLPMGLATSTGSLLSVIICLAAYGIMTRRSSV